MITLKSPEASNATKEFWAATTENRLVLPYCSDCAEYFFYPRRLCPVCMSADVTYQDASGRGTIVTYTTIHRAPTKHYQEMSPYVNALVDLEEDVRVMTNIDVESEDELAVGMPVEVMFVETESEYKLPYFTPQDP